MSEQQLRATGLVLDDEGVQQIGTLGADILVLGLITVYREDIYEVAPRFSEVSTLDTRFQPDPLEVADPTGFRALADVFVDSALSEYCQEAWDPGQQLCLTVMLWTRIEHIAWTTNQ